MARTTKTITLDTERDRDLLQWMARQHNLAQAIRDALRSAISRPPEATLDQVLHAIQDLEAKIQHMPAAPAQMPPSGGDAPGTEEAGKALDRLGL